ncbi:MAG: hypothetical protein SFV81_25260 [Pirellulaceae bacterium]|nr:hypothetical protein [Pirellulaceae bacterium]
MNKIQNSALRSTSNPTLVLQRGSGDGKAAFLGSSRLEGDERESIAITNLVVAIMKSD